MNYEKIVTLYDTAQHAEAAKRDLAAAGFEPGEISMIDSTTIGEASERLRDPGLWRRLFGRDIADHEAAVYGRTVESGGVVLTVRVPEFDVVRAMAILNAHRAVDVKERAVKEGLTVAAFRPSAAPATSVPATAIPATSTAGASLGEQVIGLAEEQINVGKRLVEHGTTRIRRFVTEKPVEAQVSLHEEHVEVIRRAITDPEYVRNLEWADKTVEVTETAEEPVVRKTAHIVEEVVIRKGGSDHVETVRDKVRRQQIDVERTADQKRKAG
jgi:stress response protein YsnF